MVEGISLSLLLLDCFYLTFYSTWHVEAGRASSLLPSRGPSGAQPLLKSKKRIGCLIDSLRLLCPVQYLRPTGSSERCFTLTLCLQRKNLWCGCIYPACSILNIQTLPLLLERS